MNVLCSSVMCWYIPSRPSPAQGYPSYLCILKYFITPSQPCHGRGKTAPHGVPRCACLNLVWAPGSNDCRAGWYRDCSLHEHGSRRDNTIRELCLDSVPAAIGARPPSNMPYPCLPRTLVLFRLGHRREFLERFPNRLDGASKLLLGNDERGREPDDVTVRRFRLDQICQSVIRARDM